MSSQSVRSVVGSGLAALPWCCIAPAVLAISGMATAGLGSALQSFSPAFLVVSVGLLGRSSYLAFVKRQGPVWIRIMVLLAATAIAGVWAFRFGGFAF